MAPVLTHYAFGGPFCTGEDDDGWRKNAAKHIPSPKEGRQRRRKRRLLKAKAE